MRTRVTLDKNKISRLEQELRELALKALTLDTPSDILRMIDNCHKMVIRFKKNEIVYLNELPEDCQRQLKAWRQEKMSWVQFTDESLKN